MREEEFLAALTGRTSDLPLAVEAMRATGQPFCLIGGLAVNLLTSSPLHKQAWPQLQLSWGAHAPSRAVVGALAGHTGACEQAIAW